MSMFQRLARFTDARRRARVARNTELLIGSLPHEIQRDIGWANGPRTSISGTVSLHGWGGPQQ